MPVDAKLDCRYFMKNRDRLLRLIDFLKKNPDLSDHDISTRQIQEVITRRGLGLRESYAVSAMASLPQFISSFGGVEYFRTTPLELVAGHRAVAVFVIHFLQDVPNDDGKCTYFKCSLVMARKLFMKIFEVEKQEEVSEIQIRAMQHILQSSNYYNDYFSIKDLPVDPNWEKEVFLNRIRDFILQQIEFDNEKNVKIEKKIDINRDDEDVVEEIDGKGDDGKEDKVEHYDGVEDDDGKEEDESHQYERVKDDDGKEDEGDQDDGVNDNDGKEDEDEKYDGVKNEVEEDVNVENQECPPPVQIQDVKKNPNIAKRAKSSRVIKAPKRLNL